MYKVFDATVSSTDSTDGRTISYNAYRTVDGNTDVPTISGNGNKFVRDDAGNVYYGTLTDSATASSIQIVVGGKTEYLTPKTGELESTEAEAVSLAIRAYLKLDSSNESEKAKPEADVNVDGGFDTLKITGLTYGYYYITTDAGSAIALTSTNPNGEIQAKNDVPSIEKIITSVTDGGNDAQINKGSVQSDGKKAIAEVGSTAYYQSTVQVKKGAQDYVFRDHMDSTLSYNKDSVTIRSKVGDNNEETVNSTNYTLTETAGADSVDGKNTEYTFKITFDNTFIGNLANQQNTNTPVTLIVTYSAKVTNAELHTTPAKNTATISYGQHISDPSTTEVYNAKFTATKHVDNNGIAGAALSGAQFVLKNSEGKYYKYTPATAGQDASPAKIEWVDSATGATVLESASDGAVKNQALGLDGFVGLSDGNYSLHEQKAPDGYNAIEDYSFTVKDAKQTGAFESSNLIQSKDVLDRAGTELPTAGGPGTVWLYVIGGILVAAAAVGLIARRRMHQH